MTAVLEPAGAAVPDGFELTQNFPNPFNPDTRIRFTLPIDGQMSLQIYNTAGQLVRSLAEGTHRAGFYDVTWDGTDDAGRRIASGTYLYHLEMETAGYSESRRMTLTR
jgi:flagellar hook assembly protein FlgD